MVFFLCFRPQKREAFSAKKLQSSGKWMVTENKVVNCRGRETESLYDNDGYWDSENTINSNIRLTLILISKFLPLDEFLTIYYWSFPHCNSVTVSWTQYLPFVMCSLPLSTSLNPMNFLCDMFTVFLNRNRESSFLREFMPHCEASFWWRGHLSFISRVSEMNIDKKSTAPLLFWRDSR